MQQRRLDVSTGAGGLVMIRRVRFDSHMNECTGCHEIGFCAIAQGLWRATIQEALRQQQGVKA